MKTKPGNPYPLGATRVSGGTNFAIFSEHAEAVELCLVASDGAETRVPLKHRTGFVWHLFVEGVAPGQRYAYRVHGKYEPDHGLRFNPSVRVLDPYAKALSGAQEWAAGSFGYDSAAGQEDLVLGTANALGAPLSLVTETRFDWGNDASPNIPFHEVIVYEAHVKG